MPIPPADCRDKDTVFYVTKADRPYLLSEPEGVESPWRECVGDDRVLSPDVEPARLGADVLAENERCRLAYGIAD
jgi:hypothetical protein